MGIIKRLDPLEARKIAAGEVIERPLNIIKELIENSIDAQATNISVCLKAGGLEYISVLDNGQGILKEDIKDAFEHHCTSKITCLDDLWKIDSFGFRGEALSSIAAISNVTITTKNIAQEKATCYKIGPEISTDLETVSAPYGTCIIIKNLFDNIPARKKFQKSIETEFRLIYNQILIFSLNHPNIFFELKHDEKTIFQLTACLEEERITNSLNLKKTDLVNIELEDPENKIKLSGWFSSPEVTKYNRQGITIFVNNRPVKNNNLVKAVIRGYGSTITNKFPYAVVKLKVSPSSIDMNVHPKKEEVRFSKENIILSLITKAASQAIYKRSQIMLEPIKTNTFKTDIYQELNYPKNNLDHNYNYNNLNTNKLINNQSLNKNLVINNLVQEKILNQNQNYQIQAEPEIEICNFIGLLDNTYLLFSSPEGLLIIDQHAAHERIIYESINKNFDTQLNDSIVIDMLFPLSIKLNESTSWFMEQQEVFNKIGIKYDQLSEDTIAIKAIPVYLKNKRIDELFHEIALKSQDLDNINLDNIELNKESIKNKIKHLVQSTTACKAAIKAGDILTSYEAKKILADLKQCQESSHCPHGRPTSFVFELKDIAKEFRRYLK